MRQFPEILCVGAAHWDVIARADRQIATGGDVPGRVRRRPGGVALNVAVALARRGRQVGLVAAVGSDAAGDLLVERLNGEGLDCARLRRVAGATDRYVVIEEPGGEVFAAVADCAALEASGAVMLAALQDALAAAGEPAWAGTVVLDGNLPGEPLLALVSASALAAARVALVCASPAKAARIGPAMTARPLTLYANRLEAEAICDRALASSLAAAMALRERGVARAVVTDGARDAAFACAAATHTATPEPGVALSMTGAGDAFVAAHLLAESEGLDPPTALAAALAGSARHVAGDAE